MKRTSLFATAALIALAATTHAQELNYAEYEMLFGEPVTTGATGTPQRASDVPINMSIITADDIRRSGARDIIEVLRRQVGLDVQRTGQTAAAISMRGMNIDSGRLRVLINGRDTFRNYEGLTIWSAIPVSMEEIRQIEVVRGPSTALYGANAVTGVINIITYNPLYEDHSNVSARVGLDDHYELTGHKTFQLPDQRGGVRVSYGHGSFDRFDVEDLTVEQLLIRPAPEYTRYGIDGLFQFTDSIQAGFEFTQFEGDARVTTAFGSTSDSQIDDQSLKFVLSANTSWGSWRFQAHRNEQSEERLRFARNTVLGESVDATSTAFSLSNVFKPSAAFDVRLAAGYQDDSAVQFGGTDLDGTGDVGYTTVYLSGLVDWSINRQVRLATSLRLDQLDTFRDAAEADFLAFGNDDYGDYSVLSANVGLTWSTDRSGQFRATYARGFNAPSIFRIGGEIQEGSRGIDGVGGSPITTPEISQQFELGWERELPRLNGRLDVALYHRIDDDILRDGYLGAAYPTDTGVVYLGSANIGEAETTGFELSLEAQMSERFAWGIQYAYANTDTVDVSAPNGSAGLAADFGSYVDNFFDGRSSEHIATATGRWTGEHYWIDVLYQYKSGFTGPRSPSSRPDLVTVSDLNLVNLTLGYELTDSLDFILTGEGLLEDQRQEVVSATSQADRRAWARLSWDF